jgi:prevent-host-death family protein
MERIPTSKARQQFAEIVRRAAKNGRRVKITHYGKTVVGLIPAADLELLKDCEESFGEDGPPPRKRAGGQR